MRIPSCVNCNADMILDGDDLLCEHCDIGSLEALQLYNQLPEDPVPETAESRLQKVTTQRDELLAAFKALDNALLVAWENGTLSHEVVSYELVTAYRTAIAKVEKQNV